MEVLETQNALLVSIFRRDMCSAHRIMPCFTLKPPLMHVIFMHFKEGKLLRDNIVTRIFNDYDTYINGGQGCL